MWKPMMPTQGYLGKVHVPELELEQKLN